MSQIKLLEKQAHHKKGKQYHGGTMNTKTQYGILKNFLINLKKTRALSDHINLKESRAASRYITKKQKTES